MHRVAASGAVAQCTVGAPGHFRIGEQNAIGASGMSQPGRKQGLIAKIFAAVGGGKQWRAVANQPGFAISDGLLAANPFSMQLHGEY